ncbi:MAG: alpha/beta hydrolase [Caldilineaceae bacterium]|nr:alpha/beta hydrolase [Caldilineaceae bacterium]
MAKFDTGTGFIHYEIIEKPGAAQPTLTLLHNFMSTGRAAWGPMLDDLSERFRILLPDLPGHGQSIGHPAGFRHDDLAEQTAAFMTACGADAGHIAGCSSGGMITQLLVQRGLIRPASVTLVSTTYTTDPRKLFDSEAAFTTENFRAGAGWMEATARLHDPYHYDGYYEESLLAAFRKFGPEETIDLPLASYATWSMPVCIIHGERDEFFPVSVPRRLAAALPDAQLHIVPRQTHALIFRRPQEVERLMLNFYDKLSEERS